MVYDDPIEIHLQLLKAAEHGRVTAIQCPVCSRPEVSVWFTLPAPEQCRTWFVCDNCDFHTRVQTSGKPKYFTQTRVKPKLDELDLASLHTPLL
jgi:hypothetical protein